MKIRSRPIAGATALASVALVLSAGAPAAQACGLTATAQAKQSRAASGSAPFVVGDSTMLLAASRLAANGLTADAQGCRQFDTGVAMLSARRHAHQLPDLAILALGSNGAVTGTQIGRALAITGRHRVLGLVTPVNSASTRAAMHRAAHRHPKRVLLIDWYRHSAGKAAWFTDGLHLTHTGARAFARYIVQRSRPTVRALRAAR